MSSSGSFSTSAYDGRYLKFSWSIKSQDVTNNKTTISWSLKGAGGATNTWYMAQNFKCVINGTTVYSSSSSIKLYNGTTVASGTATIAHNSDGTKTFSASAQAGIYYSSVNCSGSGSWTLTAIPRYANVTQSLSSKTETTLKIKWTADATVDYIWYSKDDGTNWTALDVTDGKSGTYTLTGLTANTTYKVKTRVRNKSSQLKSDSTTLSVKTYQYPYATVMPNFTIGKGVELELFNPLNRTIDVSFIGANNAVLATYEDMFGDIVGMMGTPQETQALYESIPSAHSGTYKIRCTYGTHSITKTGGTYTVKDADVRPTIGTATYKDKNSSATAITGNDQDIVRNISVVEYTAQNFTTKYGATVASVSVKVNGATYALTNDGTKWTGGNAVIDSGSNINAVFTVTDSRGVTNTKSITVTMIDWTNPSAIITLERENNFYTETDLTVDADYTHIGTNDISIAYQAKINGTSTWTVSGTAQDNVMTVVNLDNAYAWDIQIILTDSFGGSTTYNAYVSKGMPIIYFDRLKSSVGINCFPTGNETLENKGYNLDYEIGTPTVQQEWQNYNTNENPYLVRQGRVVHFHWACKPTQSITLNTTQSICCVLPSGFLPSTGLEFLCQSSGTEVFLCRIGTTGNVAISRCRDYDGQYVTAGTTHWFPITATWII